MTFGGGSDRHLFVESRIEINNATNTTPILYCEAPAKYNESLPLWQGKKGRCAKNFQVAFWGLHVVYLGMLPDHLFFDFMNAPLS